ncbi:MAG: ATP synthase F1 subunit delta [Bacteroidetes bacterium]|nr:ATP synthase F1 subunit delta [Bacteroidota bacterium]
MSESKIASRYAKSLYDKAADTGDLESVASDIKNLNLISHSNRDFNRFLNSPLISRETKKATLAKIFASFNKETINLFNLMADKSRENLIAFVGQEFTKIYNQNHGITIAVVTSATELDKDSLEKVENYVRSKTGAKKVEITTETDPSLIGGMTIMFEGKIYDSSVSGQINKIKTELNIA